MKTILYRDNKSTFSSSLAKKNTKSFYFFAEPSFVEGMIRLVDFTGTLTIYNDNETPREADFKALENDWRVVGDDLKDSILNHSINEYERTKGVVASIY